MELFGLKRQRPNLIKGFVAGALAGLIGAGFKLVCEMIISPRPAGRESPPVIMIANMRGEPMYEREKPFAIHGIHWSFAAVVSGLYGALAEYIPLVKAGRGAAYGFLLWFVGHELALPALELSPPAQELPASEQINESVTHTMFGMVVEAARGWLRNSI